MSPSRSQLRRCIFSASVIFTGLVSALPWDGAKPTEAGVVAAAAEYALGWTPKPTAAPLPRFGDGSQGYSPYDPKGLFRRDSNTDRLCGWVSGDIESPWTCDYTAAWCTEYVGLIGCCYWDGSTSACGFRTACVDSTAYSTDCDSSCRMDTVYKKCTDATAPYCAIYSATSFGGISVYGCVDSGPFNRSLLARSDLIASTSRTPPSTTGAQVVTVTVDSSPKDSNSASLSASESDSPTSSSTASSSTASDSSSNTGAIAGGVVGGIAVLGLGAMAFLFIRRRGKNSAQPAAGAAGAAEMPYPPQPPQPPMGYVPVPQPDYNQNQLYPQQTYYAEAPSPVHSPSPQPYYAGQEGYYAPHVVKDPVVPPVELAADTTENMVELSAVPTR